MTVIVGLEIHCQLDTATKLFCGCSTDYRDDLPNSHVCPVCLGLPGALPVLNGQAVALALRVAASLGAGVARRSAFARKNYFYPDLPKGYQISQYELPICLGGGIDIETEAGARRVRLTRIHMEEDTGKNVHDAHDDASLVDYNRCGVPLLEIVSEPDMHSPAEAAAYLRKLRAILQYIGVCDGNMEEGSLRCDANVSVRPKGSETLGTRVEIKNLNSFRFLQKALDYEIERQSGVLAEGGTIVQETRLWNDAEGRTFPMRSKEEAHDYRYFPEPDLLPLKLDPAWIEGVRQGLPELPGPRMQRFVDDYGLSVDDALQLAATPAAADYFEACARESKNPRASANWIMGDLAFVLKNSGKSIEESPVAPAGLAALIRTVDSGEISGKIAKTVFEEMARSGEAPERVIRRLGLAQVSDEASLAAVIDRIMESNRKQVAEYRSGKTKVMSFFVGQVMRETRGQANPQVVNELLQKKLAAD